jgi:hypothetical protein
MNQILSRCWKQGKIMTINSKVIVDGLPILSNPNNVLLDNLFTTRWTISVEYQLIGSNKPRFLTNVYGPFTPQDKIKFIQNLDQLANLIIYHSWILGGECNMVFHLEVKRGETRRLKEESGHFQALIDNLCLIDLEK